MALTETCLKQKFLPTRWQVPVCKLFFLENWPDVSQSSLSCKLTLQKVKVPFFSVFFDQRWCPSGHCRVWTVNFNKVQQIVSSQIQYVVLSLLCSSEFIMTCFQTAKVTNSCSSVCGVHFIVSFAVKKNLLANGYLHKFPTN